MLCKDLGTLEGEQQGWEQSTQCPNHSLHICWGKKKQLTLIALNTHTGEGISKWSELVKTCSQMSNTWGNPARDPRQVGSAGSHVSEALMSEGVFFLSKCKSQDQFFSITAAKQAVR